MKYIIIFFLAVTTLGCNQPELTSIKIRSIGESTVYSISNGDNEVVKITVDPLGNLVSVSNPIENFTQIISYNDSTGYISGKALQGSNGLQQGIVYFFNDNNERLHSVVGFTDDTRVGKGFSFYDGMNRVKDYVEYDTSGVMIFTRSYDQYGNVVHD